MARESLKSLFDRAERFTSDAAGNITEKFNSTKDSISSYFNDFAKSDAVGGIAGANGASGSGVKSVTEYPRKLSSMGVPYVRFEILVSTASTKLGGDAQNTQRPNIDPSKTNRSLTAETVLRKALGESKQQTKVEGSDNKTDDPQAGKINEKEKTSLIQSGRLQRLDRVIALQMPRNVLFQNEISYRDESQGKFEQVVDTVIKPTETLGGALVKLATRGILNNVSGLERNLRFATNPKVEKSFDSVTRRRFTMDFVFAPKNESEAFDVMNIVKTFRYYSLPELAGGRFFYLYPAEFEITFFAPDGQENTAIPRISQCAITNVSVNYTPNGEFVTFSNGLPTVFEMTLALEELEIQDNQRVAGGF